MKPGTSRRKKQASSTAAALRRRAEATLGRTATDIGARSPAEIQRLVYELQMQNEGLRHEMAELAQSRDQYRELFDFAPSGYLTVDHNAKVLQANATAARLLGVTKEAVTGKRFSCFVDRGSQDAFCLHQRVVRELGAHECELTLRRPDGSTFDAQLDTRFVAGSELGDGRCRCIVTDVTERRLAHEHYQLAFEDNPLPMLIFDEHTLNLLAVNDAAVKHYGWTREEFLRMSIKDVRPPDELPKLMRALKVPRGKRLAFAGEWKHWKKDGRIFDAAINYSTIRFRGRDARLAMIRDVTERKRTQEALRESEGRFRQMAENVQEVFWLTDMALTQMLYVSPAFEQIWGISCAELYANPRRWLESIHPDDRERVRKEFRVGRTQTFQVQVEYRIVRPDGSIRWISDHGAVVKDQHGRSYRRAGVARDITEHKEAEVELRKSEARFRRLHESLRDAFVSVDMTGRIVEFNNAYSRMLGYTKDELRRLTNVGLTPEKWHRKEAKLVRERILRRGYSGVYEKEYRRKDGTVIPVELSAFLIRDDAGKPAAMWAIVREITERKQAEAALRESEARFRDVLEHSVDAGYRRNLKTGGYDYISPAIKGITGFSPSQIMAHPPEKVFEFIHPADVFHVKRAHWLALKSHRPLRRLEYRFRCKDGSYRWLAESFRVVRDRKGKPQHVVGTVFDISDRKHAEEEMRQSQRLARSTVEAIPAIVCVLDKDGTILDTNQAWRSFAKTNGAKPHKTEPGANYLDVCDHVHGLGEENARRFAEGIRAVAAGRSKMFSMEYACHSPTEKRWFAGYVSPFTGLGDRRMVVAHVNITAVKLAEERFRTVIESAPDAMVIVDKQGVISIANWQAEKLFGRTRRELTGMKLEKLIPAHHRKAHVRERQQFIARPATRAMGEGRELQALHRDGSEFPVEISLSPLETVTGRLVCAVVRDITERKKAEQSIKRLNQELERRVQERTAELHAANESLRDEMAGRLRLEREILSVSEAERASIGRDLHDDLGQQIAGAWLLSSVLSNNLAAAASSESGTAHRLSTILGSALAVTRSLSRGLQPTAIEEGGLVSALHDLASRTADLFRIPCRFNSTLREVSCNCTVSAHLFRIAQESVTNAAKHGKAAHIGIRLECVRGGCLHLIITDDGVGIPREQPQNAGIGLSIMKYRADLIGGTFDIRRRPEGGTQVTCTLPADCIETANHQPQGKPQAKPRQNPQSGRRRRKAPPPRK